MTLLIITIVLVWIAQRGLAVHQAMRFRRQYSTLRRGGRAVAVGASRRRGRRVYVALAADKDGIVVENLVFRGVTVFAIGREEPRLDGLAAGQLAQGMVPAGVDRLLADAAKQAASFLLSTDKTGGDLRPRVTGRPPHAEKTRAAAPGT